MKMDVLDQLLGYVNKLGPSKIFLVLVVIGFQIYFVNITAPIPNYNNETKTIYYGATDLVVPNNVTWFHTLFPSLAVLMFTYLIFISKEQFEILNHNDVKELINAEFQYLKQKDDRFKNSELENLNFTLKRQLINDKMVPNRYVYVGEVIPPESSGTSNFYYRFEVNPYTGRIERELEVADSLELKQMCGNCGQLSTSDFKMLVPSELAEWIEVKRSLTERGDKR